MPTFECGCVQCRTIHFFFRDSGGFRVCVLPQFYAHVLGIRPLADVCVLVFMFACCVLQDMETADDGAAQDEGEVTSMPLDGSGGQDIDEY